MQPPPLSLTNSFIAHKRPFIRSQRPFIARKLLHRSPNRLHCSKLLHRHKLLHRSQTPHRVENSLPRSHSLLTNSLHRSKNSLHPLTTPSIATNLSSGSKTPFLAHKRPQTPSLLTKTPLPSLRQKPPSLLTTPTPQRPHRSHKRPSSLTRLLYRSKTPSSLTNSYPLTNAFIARKLPLAHTTPVSPRFILLTNPSLLTETSSSLTKRSYKNSLHCSHKLLFFPSASTINSLHRSGKPPFPRASTTKRTLQLPHITPLFHGSQNALHSGSQTALHSLNSSLLSSSKTPFLAFTNSLHRSQTPFIAQKTPFSAHTPFIAHKLPSLLTNSLHRSQTPFIARKTPFLAHKRPSLLTNALHCSQTPFIAHKRPSSLNSSLYRSKTLLIARKRPSSLKISLHSGSILPPGVPPPPTPPLPPPLLSLRPPPPPLSPPPPPCPSPSHAPSLLSTLLLPSSSPAPPPPSRSSSPPLPAPPPLLPLPFSSSCSSSLPLPLLPPLPPACFPSPASLSPPSLSSSPPSPLPASPPFLPPSPPSFPLSFLNTSRSL
ncbi:hypothetical protein C7M84_001669 [Penaeus vannamei]|uniref:Uncharacterized protein n=1 Tax=Penaeus vannamei TaxID=6689 RepID=A0A3R7SX83_PENVA|nr:hypothetical protein C7M84_001669 [Penaeus vannamei]